MTASAGSPLFTVVVPTRNRPESLARCLGALAAQDASREQFEVVVVDDGSAASPRLMVERFARDLPCRLVEQENAGPAAARNAGAAAARGSYLAFTDDDCRPDAGWLTALARAIGQHPGCAVGGRVDNALGGGVYSTASQLLIDFLYEYYNANESGARFFVTSSLAFPTAAFLALNGFDETFPLAAAEDRDMCDRWHANGHRLVYEDAAIVRHAHALGFWSFCRQHFNYGRGAYHLRRARSRRGEESLRVEPFQFYSRLVRYPLSRDRMPRAIALSALALASQVVYVAGYFLERVGGSRRSRGGGSVASPELQDGR